MVQTNKQDRDYSHPCCTDCVIYLDYKDAYQCSDDMCKCHHTPDIDIEKVIDKLCVTDYGTVSTDTETRRINPYLTMNRVRELLTEAITSRDTSRDTYWKERVKQVSYEVVKEFQDSLITIAIENEHMRGCVTSNQIIQAFKDFEASSHPALDTLLDNLN